MYGHRLAPIVRGVGCLQIHARQHIAKHGRSFPGPFHQLRPGHVADAEFEWAVTDVARGAHAVADEVVEVAEQVVAQRSAGIADAFGNLPDAVVVRVGFYFCLQLLEALLEKVEEFVFHDRVWFKLQ